MYMSLFSTRRLDPAPGRHRRAAGVDPPGARPARPRSPCRPSLTSTWRPGGRARRRGARRRRHSRLAAHLFTLATTAPPGKEVRVTGIGAAPGRRSGARRGSAGTRPVARGPLAHGGVAHAGVGGLRRGLRRRRRVRRRRPRRARRATCCSCSPPAPACRRTSAPPSARSASCAASGWTAPAAWPGSRTTPRRSTAHADLPVPERARTTASASSTCRSPTRAPTGCVLDDVDLRPARRRGGRGRRRERRRQDARS